MAVPMATKTKVWTLDELHSLPEDGNTYELVRGELFVTPAPTVNHEEIARRLTGILVPFVTANGLGYVYHPHAVIQFEASQAEPDLMVRQPHPEPDAGWEAWPVPLLVIEISSPTTRRRDHEQKKSFYMGAAVGEYWIVDPESRSITVVRRGERDRVETERVDWQPRNSQTALAVSIDDVFGEIRRR